MKTLIILEIILLLILGVIREILRSIRQIISQVNGNSLWLFKQYIILLSDYKSLDATAYLLRSPENAQRLLDSIQQARNGKVVERDLIEE